MEVHVTSDHFTTHTQSSFWPGQLELIDNSVFFLQMIVQARRPQSPSLYTNEEARSRTCSRQKLSYSNGTVVVDEDDSSSSEMQLTSRQSGDSLASLLPPTGNQFFCYSSCDVCVCRRTEEEARKLSAEEA